MEPGDILGHEFMGEIVEVGSEVKKLKKGDRTVVSSAIGCGHCYAGSFADYIRIPFAMFKHKQDQCIKVMLQPD